jgi:hypothetical protein
MGYDLKYGKVTTERKGGDIPDDEIVVVFRSRDKLLAALLREYARRAAVEGCPEDHVDLVLSAAEEVLRWQADHPDRVILPTSAAFLAGDGAGDREARSHPRLYRVAEEQGGTMSHLRDDVYFDHEKTPQPLDHCYRRQYQHDHSECVREEIEGHEAWHAEDDARECSEQCAYDPSEPCSWCGGIGCTDACRHSSTDEGVCCPTHAPHSSKEHEILARAFAWLKQAIGFLPHERRLSAVVALDTLAESVNRRTTSLSAPTPPSILNPPAIAGVEDADRRRTLADACLMLKNVTVGPEFEQTRAWLQGYVHNLHVATATPSPVDLRALAEEIACDEWCDRRQQRAGFPPAHDHGLGYRLVVNANAQRLERHLSGRRSE